MPCLQTVGLVRLEVLADEHLTAYPNMYRDLHVPSPQGTHHEG